MSDRFIDTTLIPRLRSVLSLFVKYISSSPDSSHAGMSVVRVQYPSAFSSLYISPGSIVSSSFPGCFNFSSALSPKKYPATFNLLFVSSSHTFWMTGLYAASFREFLTFTIPFVAHCAKRSSLILTPASILAARLSAESLGKAFATTATAPVTAGVAIEVPLIIANGVPSLSSVSLISSI